jgi:hypothetical protein
MSRPYCAKNTMVAKGTTAFRRQVPPARKRLNSSDINYARSPCRAGFAQ